MDRSGSFFTHYYHLYKVVTGAEQAGEEGLTFTTKVRNWVEVDQKFFERYEPMLGMVVLSKGEDGQVNRENFPAGYQYVGNRRYGEWRSDSSGNSFWVFYGQYALFRDLLGMGTHPIYRSHWDDYRSYRGSGRPWFGSARQFGTHGSFTRTANPTFYERQQSRQASRSRNFSDRVRQRSGMSGSRGRSGARGK